MLITSYEDARHKLPRLSHAIGSENGQLIAQDIFTNSQSSLLWIFNINMQFSKMTTSDDIIFTYSNLKCKFFIVHSRIKNWHDSQYDCYHMQPDKTNVPTTCNRGKFFYIRVDNSAVVSRAEWPADYASYTRIHRQPQLTTVNLIKQKHLI